MNSYKPIGLDSTRLGVKWHKKSFDWVGSGENRCL